MNYYIQTSDFGRFPSLYQLKISPQVKRHLRSSRVQYVQVLSDFLLC